MKLRITIIFLALSLSIFGKQVPVDKAREAAANFLSQSSISQFKASPQLNLIQIPLASPGKFVSSTIKSASDEELYYIFNINQDQGFIIVSGDDEAIPILAYSYTGGIEPSDVPPNFRKWIEGYKNQIRFIRSDPRADHSKINKHWELLLSGNTIPSSKSTSSVEPLLTTQWNQSPYYNQLCPFDNNESELSVSGCVATAMAQIMKYWNYPERGNGYHSYNHEQLGVISANFGSAEYDWAAMPDVVNSPNPAVATLMFHCGVSVDMNYSAQSSGAYVIIDRSPVVHCSEYAFKTYFGYDPNLSGVLRENYTTEAWVQMLQTELEAGRPIEYAGFGAGGGHAFVCDGYDSNDFFHFNWGWAGYYDGYFAIDALDPGGTGIGGGSGGYNSGHQAVIGIRPPENQTALDLRLYDALSISENPLFYADSFNIHSDIGNFGNNTFEGDLCVAIFDKDNTFIEYAKLIEGISLGDGLHFSNGLDFSNPGSFNLLPGDYSAGMFYRSEDENWTALKDGDYTNLLNFNIYYSNDIEVYEDFTLSTGTTITRESPFTVTTDILNDGESDFSGEFAVDLYDMEGYFAATIETRSAESLEAGYYYDDVIFSSDGVSIDPGTYLMALTHKPSGGDWILSGSSYATNPVKVIVKQAPLLPDIYEDNDSIETSYLIIPTYSGSVAYVSTEGSNSHAGSDVDFYQLELETGYDYTISARIHDSYNSGNEVIYTNDVLWTYYANGAWSDLFDDVLPGDIHIPGGGYLFVGVAPYYEGETGTYLLDFTINRAEAVSAASPEEQFLKVYPNPATGKLNIEASNTIKFLELFDASGREIQKVNVNAIHKTIDLTEFTDGIYYLKITQEKEISVKKIVKQ